MRNTYGLMKAATEINPEAYEAQAQDTVLAFLEAAGWIWTEPQIVTDPGGSPHYIPADGGFAEQVRLVYELHRERSERAC